MEYNIKKESKSKLFKCPICKSCDNLIFKAERSSEDTVDVWVACKCGYDYTINNPGERIETVSGINELFAAYAASSWNDHVQFKKQGWQD